MSGRMRLTTAAFLLAGSLAMSACATKAPKQLPPEPEMARFVHSWLSERGIEADVYDAAPNRPSVVARVPATERVAPRCPNLTLI